MHVHMYINICIIFNIYFCGRTGLLDMSQFLGSIHGYVRISMLLILPPLRYIYAALRGEICLYSLSHSYFHSYLLHQVQELKVSKRVSLEHIRDNLALTSHVLLKNDLILVVWYIYGPSIFLSVEYFNY